MPLNTFDRFLIATNTILLNIAHAGKGHKAYENMGQRTYTAGAEAIEDNWELRV